MDRTQTTPRIIRLQDYTPPAFLIDGVEMYVRLEQHKTTVITTLQMRRNPHATADGPLVLDGEQLKLNWVSLDNAVLADDAYSVDDKTLTIHQTPQQFTVQTEVEIHPENNTSLEGLYKSSGNFCTQCEAQGFRKITYYLDRPDVMSEFTTTVEADREKYPVLLSNGNPVERGQLDDGHHFVRWHDPFKKPAYLFALVAGDLAVNEDSFTTKSGREVKLQIYTEAHNADKTGHAMASLKKAMRWDEDTYGLEYDLDIYMIVAVDDFNMGAMENKGLNIFNSKYVLARPDTATDQAYLGIEGVIAHEYFHNWTGNRVTCRDWFQLSLKEGLTVFRDQSFTADMNSAAVKRIEDVRILRTHQFAEDASPMAHPVRPQEYQEINNFYTVTVYNKGAEVVRMYQTLLGREGFRKGMDLYFQRHDGQAVTTDDFRRAMADANDVNLDQFQRWYDQAGTPELHVTDEWDEESGNYTLKFRQTCPPTPGQDKKEPFLIPVKVALLGKEGKLLRGGENLLTITEAEQSFTCTEISEKPVPSLLRGFSAPVKLHYDYSDRDLSFLMAHDTDAFNRWDAAQTLAMRTLLALLEDPDAGRQSPAFAHLSDAVGKLLRDESSDPALIAEALVLPSEAYVSEQLDVVDPDAVHQARELLREHLAHQHADAWMAAYQRNQTPGAYVVTPADMGRRRLKNIALAYLTTLNTSAMRTLAQNQFNRADNMTDSMGAMSALAALASRERERVLGAFEKRWQGDPLVMDAWFSIQATSPLPETLDTVKKLMQHELFQITNPNKVRALIGAFAHGNPVGFHRPDGSGYQFIADRVLELDPMNPQVASRLAKAFTRWKRYDKKRQKLMKQQLQRMRDQQGLSPDVFEIVDKSLADQA